MTDLLAPLNPAQILLLQTMAAAYLRNGQWPVWHYVLKTLDSNDLDAFEVIQSLPRTGGPDDLFDGPSYGAAWPIHQFRIESDTRHGLTVAAAIHLPDLVPAMAQPFINLLRVMTQMQINAPASPDEVKDVTIGPNDLKRALPSLSNTFMARVSLILDHEPPTISGRSWTGEDGNWTRTVQREIRKYRDVQDLRGYIERVTELLPTPAPYRPVPATRAKPPQAAPVFKREYVDEALINALEAKSGASVWKMDKLIGLLRELNSNFADEHPYACHALLRAILDHVPPIFQQTGFDQVVNNHRWPTTADKEYIKKLSSFKTQGHDVLHRQISQTDPYLLQMSDFPPPIWLKTLLHNCLGLL